MFDIKRLLGLLVMVRYECRNKSGNTLYIQVHSENVTVQSDVSSCSSWLFAYQKCPMEPILTALPRWHEPVFPFITAQCNHSFCSCAATGSLVSANSNGRNIKVNLKWNAPQVVWGEWRHYFEATHLLPKLQHPRCQEATLRSLSGLDWLGCFHPSLFKAFLLPPCF